jgi:hypothetical protein
MVPCRKNVTILYSVEREGDREWNVSKVMKGYQCYHYWGKVTYVIHLLERKLLSINCNFCKNEVKMKNGYCCWENVTFVYKGIVIQDKERWSMQKRFCGREYQLPLITYIYIYIYIFMYIYICMCIYIYISRVRLSLGVVFVWQTILFLLSIHELFPVGWEMFFLQAGCWEAWHSDGRDIFATRNGHRNNPLRKMVYRMLMNWCK